MSDMEDGTTGSGDMIASISKDVRDEIVKLFVKVQRAKSEDEYHRRRQEMYVDLTNLVGDTTKSVSIDRLL
eukprot:Nk52_evm83s164 gene=Nk52_evmTU83s164